MWSCCSRGRAKVSSYTTDGKEVVLAVRGPGELLGDFSALDGGARSATVVGSRVDRGSGHPVRPVQALPRGPLRARRSCSCRPGAGALRDADRKRVEFGAYDTPGRVARRLLELVDRYGESEGADVMRISLSLTQDELAGWTGASREAVSKALREFRDRGWITTGRRSIIVLDVEALRASAFALGRA